MKPREAKSAEPATGAFVADLSTRGITLRTDGYKIWAEPKSSLTAEEMEYANAHNDELLKLVAKPAPAPRDPD